MHNVIHVIAFIVITLSSSFLLSAQAAENNYKQGYISDDLFIYMHAGPGKNYRILGTIVAGSQIKITGSIDGGYSEIITEDNRATWIESKYVTTKQGLRFAVDALNKKIANSSDYSNQLDSEVNELKNKLSLVTNEKENLSAELKKMTGVLATTERKIKNQDSAIKKEWFFNGALVLGIGLILGLILPRLFARRRASMDNWS